MKGASGTRGFRLCWRPRLDRSLAISSYRKHAKWITIVGVVLMLIAMVIYVVTGDDSIQPGKPAQERVPAAP